MASSKYVTDYSGEVCSQTFTEEEVSAGLMATLLGYLTTYHQKSDGYYMDIHITTDGCCTTIEWIKKRFSDNESGSFVHQDPEHYMMAEVRFPDGHYEFLHDEEVDEQFMNFLRDNPQWKQNEYGMWYNAEEQEEFIKTLKKGK